MLVRLASHYHRPDFGPAQVKFMTLDFIEDLEEYTIAEIEVAIREYRRNSENKFFPRPAEIRDACRENRKHRLECDRERSEGKSYLPEFGDSRPIRWWTQPRRFWKPHWHPDQIPADYRAQFAALEAKRAEAAE